MTTSRSERDPDLEAWLDEIAHQEMLEEAVRCPSCGYPMPILLMDKSKPFNQGRYGWNCSRNDTCGRMWESHYGELRERIPQDRDIS